MLNNEIPNWLVFGCIGIVVVLTFVGIYYVLKYEEKKK